MNFTPRTEKDILESRLFPKGEYDFEITDATDTESKKSGKDMIELKLRITDKTGAGRTLTDYLLPEMPLKLLHCCQVCGLDYSAGSVTAGDFIGKRGRLALGIEKDKAKEYPDKNVVTDYTAAPSPMRKNGMRKCRKRERDELCALCNREPCAEHSLACAECFAAFLASLKECPACGHILPLSGICGVCASRWDSSQSR